MLTSLTGQFLLPGISTSYDTIAKNIFWGRAELIQFDSIYLDGASRDAGNSPTTLLRPGLLLGKVTSTSKWVQWAPTATDGSQIISGVLATDLSAQLLGSNSDRFLGLVAISGGLKASCLLVPGQSSYGLSGQAYEYVIRQQLAKNFMLDDTPQMNAFGWAETRAVTADTTVTGADNNVLFVVTGGSGVNFTLPAMLRGYRFGFLNTVDQNMTITAATADTMITKGDLAADSVVFSTSSEKIGAHAIALGLASGTGPIVVNGSDCTMTVNT